MNESDAVKHLNSLGLKPTDNVNGEIIKSAWRKKCNEHHPDKGGDQDKFIEVTHAYKMLTDPDYRHSEHKQSVPDAPDLNFRVQTPVTFEDAFFGRKISMCFNRLEIGKDFKPIIKEEQEMLYVEIDLPQGCAAGHEVVKDGYGLKCNNEYGNLVVRVIPQRHIKFQLRNSDVYAEEPFPLNILLKGGDVEIMTMYGLKTFTIPPGTGPGTELTIPKFGVGRFGNHIVIVKQLFPNKDELKKDVWKGLGIDWGKAPVASEEDDLMLSFAKLRAKLHEQESL